MSGPVFLTPLHAFNAWAGNTTLLPLLKRWYMKMLQGNKKKKLTKLLLHPHQYAEGPIWRETVCCVSGSTCSYKNYHAKTFLIHTPSTKCFKIICIHTSHLITKVNTLFCTHIQPLLRVYYS